jgi:hypothetical protein
LSDGRRNRSYFALGFLWALLIAITLVVVGGVWLLIFIGSASG